MNWFRSIPIRLEAFYSQQPYLVEEYMVLSWQSRTRHGWLVAAIFTFVMTIRLLSVLEHLKRLRFFQTRGRNKPYISKSLPDIYRTFSIGVLVFILVIGGAADQPVCPILVMVWSVYRIADVWTDFLYDSLIKGAVRTSENIWSAPRNVVLVIIGYLEITVLFGFLYFEPQAELLNAQVGESPNTFISGFLQSVYFSFVTITTLGYGDLSPQNAEASLMVIVQLTIGMSLLLIALVRFMGMLRTDTSDFSRPSQATCSCVSSMNPELLSFSPYKAIKPDV
ncbi:MAG: ion channel [Halopseudomonas sp.]